MKKLQDRLFILLIVCLPLSVGTFYTHLVENDLIFAFDVLLGALYVLWFVNSNGFTKPAFTWGRLSVPFLALLLWTALSGINAISLTMYGIGLFMTVKAYLVYLYVINNVRTKVDLNRLLFWLCVGLSFQGLLGIVQYTTGSSLGLEFLGAISKNRIAGVTRVRGTLALPNRYGAWLALVVPIAACLFIFESKFKKKLLYSIPTVFGIVALLLSFSRSAWAGLLGSGGVLVILLARRRLLKGKYILGIVVAILLMVGLVIGFWDTIVLRFETGATGKYRLIMIDIALDLIKNNFLIGVGLFNYKFHQIELFRFWQPVHNTYLRLGSETGIPGLFFFLVIVYLSLREGFRMMRSRDRFIFTTALGLVCSMWAFLFTINFGPEYHHYRIKFLFWFILGTIFSLRTIHNNTLQARRRKRPQQKPPMKAGPSQRDVNLLQSKNMSGLEK